MVALHARLARPSLPGSLDPPCLARPVMPFITIMRSTIVIFTFQSDPLFNDVIGPLQLTLVVFFLRALAHLLMHILQLALCSGGGACGCIFM